MFLPRPGIFLGLPGRYSAFFPSNLWFPWTWTAEARRIPGRVFNSSWTWCQLAALVQEGLGGGELQLPTALLGEVDLLSPRAPEQPPGAYSGQLFPHPGEPSQDRQCGPNTDEVGSQESLLVLWHVIKPSPQNSLSLSDWASSYSWSESQVSLPWGLGVWIRGPVGYSVSFSMSPLQQITMRIPG